MKTNQKRNMQFISKRENEHLKTCDTCARAWPLFLHIQVSVFRNSPAQTAQEWMKLSERNRDLVFDRLKREETRWIRNAERHRSPSPYNMFVKSQSSKSFPTIMSFAEKIKALASKWNRMTPDEKLPFQQQSNEKKKTQKSVIKALPSSTKRKLSELRKRNRSTKRKRPNNSFMLYLQDRWQDEKRKPDHVGYKTIMKQASEDWKTKLTSDQKLPYIHLANKLALKWKAETISESSK